MEVEVLEAGHPHKCGNADDIHQQKRKGDWKSQEEEKDEASDEEEQYYPPIHPNILPLTAAGETQISNDVGASALSLECLNESTDELKRQEEKAERDHHQDIPFGHVHRLNIDDSSGEMLPCG